MATEDLTTFTEVDPAGDLSATSSTLTVSTQNSRNDTTYFYKDYTAGHFGDFTHYFEFNITLSQDSAFGTLWALANAVGDTKAMDDANSGLQVSSEEAGATQDVVIVDDSDGEFSSAITVSRSTTYYATMVRSGTTATLSIFTDSGRTAHATGSPVSLTVPSTTWRYLYAYASYDDNAAAPDDFSATVSNIDLNEAPVGGGVNRMSRLTLLGAG